MVEITSGESLFEALKHWDERGEYWLARDLMKPLGYSRWQRFADAIERAQVALRTNGEDPDQHITDVGKKMIKEDYRLTRYGVYATIQGADPRKPEIAAGWAYFRVKTRQAETAEIAAPRTYLDALEAAVATERARLVLAAKVRELAPKAEAADAFIKPEGWIPNREASKMLYGAIKDGPNRMLRKLESLGVFYRSSQKNLLPYQDPWVNKGWIRSARVTAPNVRFLVPEVQYSNKGIVAVYFKLRDAGESVRDPREEAA